MKNYVLNVFRTATRLLWPGGFGGVVFGTVLMLAIGVTTPGQALWSLLASLVVMYVVALTVLVIASLRGR